MPSTFTNNEWQITAAYSEPCQVSKIESWWIQSFFGVDRFYTLYSWRCSHGWRWAVNSSKFIPPDVLKIHSLTLFLLRFICKTLLKFTFQDTLPHWWFFKIQLSKKLYDNKFVRAAKQSELKRSSKRYRRNHTTVQIFTSFNDKE